VNKDLRTAKLAPGPLLVGAIVALIAVVGASAQDRRALATTDQPAAAGTKNPTPTPKPTPTPTVTFSSSITGPALCRGTIAATTDSNDLPAADMYAELAFFKGSPATLPTAKKPVALTGISLMAINAGCPAATPAPCAQYAEFYGSIGVGATATSPGLMSLSFVTNDPSLPSDDPLDGCRASFQVLPYSKSTQAYFVSTGPLTQDPAPTADACGAIGTSIVVSCQEINE